MSRTGACAGYWAFAASRPGPRATASPDAHAASGGAASDKVGALYPRLLGRTWRDLHPAIRRMHGQQAPVRGAGTFRIVRNMSPVARLLGRIARLPPPAEAVETRLSIDREGNGERWHRTFGEHALITWQHEATGGLLAERFGALVVYFRLQVHTGTLRYRPAGAALRCGPILLPLPSLLAPRITASERAIDDETVEVTVRVSLPGVGELIRYEGSIRAEAASR